MKIDRSTYDFLNFLGDVGGLDGILVVIFLYITRSLQEWNLTNFLASEQFTTKVSSEVNPFVEKDSYDYRLGEAYNRARQSEKPVKQINLFMLLMHIISCRCDKYYKQKRINQLAGRRIEKDFDIFEINRKLR